MSTRRAFIQCTIASLTTVSAISLLSCKGAKPSSPFQETNLSKIKDLLPADKNDVMLPPGFSSRIVARSGETSCAGSSFKWHPSPDGGATFKTEDGGWVYVSNCESNIKDGGVGALRFDAKGQVIQSYRILKDTIRNCAGGATPWGTWLSCEEIITGQVWECDPLGKKAAIVRPALGSFNHEAACVDPEENIVYLTEDQHDGCFYRFVPDKLTKQGHADLSKGSLEVAVVNDNLVTWSKVMDPLATTKPTKKQVAKSTKFNGGEGIVFYKGEVIFATKGDNRVWSYHSKTKKIKVVYNGKTHINPILSNVDNVTTSDQGDILVAEDPGHLQIVVITKDSKLRPLVRLVGHNRSEVTGPAFSPDGTRLYFSSQRGSKGVGTAGITYEITGPFKG